MYYEDQETTVRGVYPIMPNREVFEIPIYRVSPEAFWKEIIEMWERSFLKSDEARGWKYNEIIGYISIRADLNQIKAEYWFIDAKVIRRDIRRKVFKHINKAFEVWVRKPDTSNDIYEKVRNYLSDLLGRKPFKGRYIDLEAFNNLGPHVNWKELTKGI